MKSFHKRHLTPLTLSLILVACSSPTGTPADNRTLDTSETEAYPQQIQPHLLSTEEPVAPEVRQLSKQRASGAADYRHPSAPPRVYPPRHRVDPYVRPDADRERYPNASDNKVKQVANAPVSTFSIDVDTAAYANARRQINGGQLPRSESVRVEEFINYFNYSYPQPENNEGPFSITTEIGPSPWNADRKLMLVGLQGYEVQRSDLPPANLVFLIDVSGSMNQPRKLGLLKSSLKLLTRGLRAEDSISIAVYAGAAGEVLAPTSGNEREKIMRAIDQLHAGGSTNGGAGIKLAYSLAQQNFSAKGINRIILATDGDFNVGTSDLDSLRRLIEQKRKTGVSLTVLGFGQGNYNDKLMQELAQKGNGNAAYVDTFNEARKVLVDEVSSTLQTIAKDVKIQVEFNPEHVQEYRLIGYETRALKREDFNNDAIDAGEIGAGHTVTALYELTLNGAKQPAVDDLRYGGKTQKSPTERAPSLNSNSELAYVKLRYKEPNGRVSKLMTRVVHAKGLDKRITQTSENFRFACAAGAFGQLLRDSDYTGDFGFGDALQLAKNARGSDEFGYRHEFEQLLRTAAELTPVLAPISQRAHSKAHEDQKLQKDVSRQRS